MRDDLLQRIQELQFVDRRAAEGLALAFIRETFRLDVVSLELRPLAVSLNSFNGFVTLADGRRLFFKTHTEPDNIITEYYNAALLAKAGYPVIQPLFQSNRSGEQLLIYEVIEDPSLFDVAWAVENAASDALETQAALLEQAQHTADDQLLQIYLNTLKWQIDDEAASAPVHQLFYHRLTAGRLERFYGPFSGQPGDDVHIALPGRDISMHEVRQVRWIINGAEYFESLDDIIERCAELLKPAQAGPSVIGHGDAHNGNVFLRQSENPPTLLYFDPAFAGQHHPLLDLAKPLFHNVFAMWMYFPHEKRQKTAISWHCDSDLWEVEHDYSLAPIREMFLYSKVERVLKPILHALKRPGWLREDWRAYLKAALFCCPFLTMNLADREKFPPEISLLGLVMAVEMGAESHSKRSLIDRILDEVAQSL